MAMWIDSSLFRMMKASSALLSDGRLIIRWLPTSLSSHRLKTRGAGTDQSCGQ